MKAMYVGFTQTRGGTIDLIEMHCSAEQIERAHALRSEWRENLARIDARMNAVGYGWERFALESAQITIGSQYDRDLRSILAEPA